MTHAFESSKGDQLTGAPDSAKKGVDQKDARPPVTPKGCEGKVVGAVLGSQEQDPHNEGVDIDDQIVVQLVWPEVTASTCHCYDKSLRPARFQPLVSPNDWEGKILFCQLGGPEMHPPDEGMNMYMIQWLFSLCGQISLQTDTIAW